MNVNYQELIGKLVKLITVYDEVLLGTVYGYNTELKLIVLVTDSPQDPKVKKIKMANTQNCKSIQMIEGEGADPMKIYEEFSKID